MRRIVTAKAEDIPGILRCLGRVEASMELYGDVFLSEEAIRRFVEEGGFFLTKDGTRIIAAAKVSHDIANTLFPSNPKQSYAEDILSLIAYQGEPIAILKTIFVDPQFQRKGIAREMLGYLLARYKGSSWLAPVLCTNGRAKDILKASGFIPSPASTENNAEMILVKRYKKDGLCQWNW